MTDAVYDYLVSSLLREPEILRELRAETATLSGARMQIAPEQGQFMRLLVEMLGAERTLEVGVFTGYSAISVALALPANGRLVACDVNEQYAAVARRYFQAAGVADRIDLRIGAAVTTLRELLAAGQAGRYDFAFIDADKENYAHYYELCLELVRPGGLVAIDNALWDGKVADAAVQDESTVAIRTLNARVAADSRVSMCLVPIGDGLLLARKRG